MKYLIFNIIFVLIICACITGIFFYTNTPKYKMQKFQDKYAGELITLKPIYKDAANYCTSQKFTNRGEYTACNEEQIKKYPYKNYQFYMDIQNFCESLFDNLADKYMCTDEIIFLTTSP